MPKEIISDSLGFGKHLLPQMEAERRAGGHDGVRFRPDPTCPEFYQVACKDGRARDRYMKSRGFYDKGSRKPPTISEKELSDAERMVRRQYGEAEGVVVAGEENGAQTVG